MLKRLKVLRLCSTAVRPANSEGILSHGCQPSAIEQGEFKQVTGNKVTLCTQSTAGLAEF